MSDPRHFIEVPLELAVFQGVGDRMGEHWGLRLLRWRTIFVCWHDAVQSRCIFSHAAEKGLHTYDGELGCGLVVLTGFYLYRDRGLRF